MLGEQAKFPHLIGNPARRVDHDLMRLFLAQVAEFFQHLVGGFEVERRLVVAVVIAEARLQNGAVDGVLGVEEMHVPGGDHGLVQLFTQRDDPAVEFPQVLLVAGGAVADHEAVVADGLNLQIVVPAGDAFDLLLRPVVDDGLKQLARLARAAQNEPLAVLIDEVPGHAGMAVEVAKVAVGNEVVEVLHAFLAGAEQNDMVALPDGIAADDGVDVLEGCGALFLGRVKHACKALGRGRRVVYGPVRVFERYAEQPAYRAELVALLLRIELAREGERIQHRCVEAHAHALALGLKHAHVKGRIVRGHGAVPDEVQELSHALGGAFLAAEHQVRNAGDFADFGLEGHAGVAQKAQLAHDLPVFQLDGAHFDDAVHGVRKPRGFKVQHHDGAVDGAVVRVGYDGDQVAQIPLHAGNELDALLLGRAEGRGEGLRAAVVGDGHGGVAPFGRLCNEHAGVRGGIHGGHGGVHVQFDALFGGGIHALDFGHLLHVAHAYGQFVQKRVHAAVSPEAHAHAVFDLTNLLHHPRPLLLGGGIGRFAARGTAHAVVVKGLAVDGGGIVIDGEGGQHRFATLEFLGIVHAGHGALDDHDTAVLGQLTDRDGHIAHGATFEHRAALGCGRLFGRGCAGSGMCRARGRSGRRGRAGAFARRAAEQRGSLGVQLGVIPRRRLVVGRGRGSEGKAPIGPHLLHPGLALAAYGQRHGGAHAEDIIDGLRQLLVQVVRAKKAHRDLVRTGEQNPPVLQAPAGIGNPGGQRGALAAQKIGQDRFVAVQVGKKLFAQGGAGDAQRHRQPGKQLTQPALQQQVVVLGNQLITQKAHIGLVGGFLIEHALNMQLATQGRNRFLKKMKQLGFVHWYASAGQSGWKPHARQDATVL